ncbi:MAG: ABC transporter substrate-binding protein [Candidatus Methanofishera endochildressiae]|uniref:ABC transporter substrate-binding protein n=1 Tax=Candidatus Methanofishera endochildressiae TaxID=2738884 RepID=A0A7Z0MNM7_9GAMM|nr:ABC transporter substrate-binding protein [Candidatus Methanofishera endochildressiae]
MIPSMSALVLGKHWRKASKQQKKQFIAAFKRRSNFFPRFPGKIFNNWDV